MLRPEDLFELAGDAAPEAGHDVPGPVLVHALQGFVDAGSAAALAAAHLLTELPSRVVARVDVDLLLDYRARRPRMSFREDRFTSFATPELLLHEVRLPNGSLLYLLVGPEPDTGWERFTSAVLLLVERLGIRLTVGLHGIPWAAPHTRPVGLTPHASDRELIAGRPRWVGEVDVPGHIGALLELRLGEAGYPSMGFTAHVPHYLAAAEFPPAAVALLEALSDTLAVELPTGKLRAAGADVLAEIDSQVRQNSETAEAVQGLERQYDAVLAGRALDGPGLMTPRLPDEEMPDADALAADVEAFLREQLGGGSSGKRVDRGPGTPEPPSAEAVDEPVEDEEAAKRP
jgi:hypothetical protein